MKTPLLIISLASLLLTAGGCKKKNETVEAVIAPCTAPAAQVNIAKSLIVGDWKWVKTEITQRSGKRIDTPASTGTTMKLSFKSDGSMAYLVNTDIQQARSYDVTPFQSGVIVLTYLDDSGTETEKYDMRVCQSVLELNNVKSSVAEVLFFEKIK